MKKGLYLIAFAVAMLTASTASAQDKYLFDHVALGTEVGTTGWGFELAAPCTRHVTFRAGFTSMPHFSMSGNVKYNSHGIREEVKVKGTLHMFDWKVLADIYPAKNLSFHFTTGFILGLPKLVKAKNLGEIKGLDPGEGLEIGDVFVRPDDNGLAHVNLEVATFKPYVGIGFGRAVSKHRLNFTCDMGVEFWGKPKVKAFSPVENQWVQVHPNDDNGDNFNKALKNISKWNVWPVLNFHLYYRIF
ncbi:MAG: hypothetical protein IJR02_06375 [Bacteroidaceae bacterium]|nr:hypothetical protein [Bacteroidaceae bacterium]MBQ6750380.1 hypothetical protein [Bacteroidaceae bacterium]